MGAACSTLTCPAGYKQKTGTHYCAANACATTDSGTCCDTDTTKCAGIGMAACTYGTTYYWDTAKNGVAATAADKATACCTEKAQCSAAYPPPAAGTSASGTSATGTTSGASKKSLEPTLYFVIATLAV